MVTTTHASSQHARMMIQVRGFPYDDTSAVSIEVVQGSNIRWNKNIQIATAQVLSFSLINNVKKNIVFKSQILIKNMRHDSF